MKIHLYRFNHDSLKQSNSKRWLDIAFTGEFLAPVKDYTLKTGDLVICEWDDFDNSFKFYRVGEEKYNYSEISAKTRNSYMFKGYDVDIYKDRVFYKLSWICLIGFNDYFQRQMSREGIVGSWVDVTHGKDYYSCSGYSMSSIRFGY